MCKYKDLYLELSGGVADAIDILVKTQLKCEELYVADTKKQNSKKACKEVKILPIHKDRT